VVPKKPVFQQAIFEAMLVISTQMKKGCMMIRLGEENIAHLPCSSSLSFGNYTGNKT